MQKSKIKTTIQNVKILANKKIASRYYKIIIAAPRIAKQAKPGQFLNVKVADNHEPLLRRPFSIHRAKGAKIEIIYEVIGQGTEILSQRKPGEFLDIIGPLGNGFNYHLPFTIYHLPILIGGGMGVAPLLFLAEKLTRNRTLVLIGAKTKSQILCGQEFKKLGCEVKIATDDGSQGHKGKVTDLLNKILPLAISHKPLAIYACGPRPMLKEISRLSQEYKIPAQISWEEHLACGIGACRGCVVKTKTGYQRVCQEGPVFTAPEIIWE